MFLQGLIPPQPTQPWRLPPQGLAVFHGECDAPRLSHYFLPRLALEGERILFLDGANCANPRLMARLAERRGLPFAQISRQIKIARAFTCFQLTELIRRVPQFLADFPAQVLMVTAFPELYFDEDVRDADAQAAFRQALGHLRRFSLPIADCRLPIDPIENRQSKIGNRQQLPVTSPPAVTVALFSSASRFQPPACRKYFFTQTCAAAAELWKFQLDGQGRLGLLKTGAGDWGLGAGERTKLEIRNW